MSFLMLGTGEQRVRFARRCVLAFCLAFFLWYSGGVAWAHHHQQLQVSEVRPQITERSGEIVIKVDDYNAAREQILGALSRLGAELADAKTDVSEKGRRHGWVRVALPVNQLAAALPILRSAGKVAAEKIDTTDNTSDYESLARRAEKLEQHQSRLAGILSSERRLRGSDILFVQERLFRAGVDEAMLRQQRDDMARDSRTCRLTIVLFEPIPTGTIERVRLNAAEHFAAAQARAVGIVDRTKARAVTAAAYAAVFAPVWAPLLLLALVTLGVLLRVIVRQIKAHPYLLQNLFRRAVAVGRALFALLPERVRNAFQSVAAAATGAQIALQTTPIALPTNSPSENPATGE